jgi:VCBS repeat-containing protein
MNVWGVKRSLALFALLALPALAGAETLDLGSHGKFSITVPKDWTYSAQRMQDTGYTVTLSAPGGANAKCLLTLVYTDGTEALSKEKVQSDVLGACDQFVAESVEKVKVLRDFDVPGAYGVYCVFTDASMVGKPAQPDSFKAVALGEVRLSDEVTVSVSLLFDDERGAELRAMLDAVSSVSVAGAK